VVGDNNWLRPEELPTVPVPVSIPRGNLCQDTVSNTAGTSGIPAGSLPNLRPAWCCPPRRRRGGQR